MTEKLSVDEAWKRLDEALAKLQASGEPPDTAWAEDLPEAEPLDDPDEVSVTFIDQS